MPYSTNFGDRKLQQIWQFSTNPSKFHPPKIYILADLLYQAVNLQVFFFTKTYLDNNPPIFSTTKVLHYTIYGNLENMLILYSVHVNRNTVNTTKYTCTSCSVVVTDYISTLEQMIYKSRQIKGTIASHHNTLLPNNWSPFLTSFRCCYAYCLTARLLKRALSVMRNSQTISYCNKHKENKLLIPILLHTKIHT